MLRKKKSNIHMLCMGVLMAATLTVAASFITHSASNKFHAVSDTGVPGYALSNPLKGPAYAVGNMNGVKMKIPREFMLFGVQYAGEDIWKPIPRTKAPDMDTPIENFSLLLRLSNLEPIRSIQDLADYRAEDRRKAPRAWTTIGIERSSRALGESSAEWTRRVVDNIRSFRAADPDHFRVVDINESVHGLSHFYIENYRLRPDEVTSNKTVHTYYDAEQWSAYIECADPLPTATVKTYPCRHKFYISALNAIIHISYDIDQLPRWKEIQEKITNRLLSFAVETS